MYTIIFRLRVAEKGPAFNLGGRAGSYTREIAAIERAWQGGAITPGKLQQFGGHGRAGGTQGHL